MTDEYLSEKCNSHVEKELGTMKIKIPNGIDQEGRSVFNEVEIKEKDILNAAYKKIDELQHKLNIAVAALQEIINHQEQDKSRELAVTTLLVIQPSQEREYVP